MTAAERRKIMLWLELRGFGGLKVLYMGKWRGRLPGERDLRPDEYINVEDAKWSTAR